jgi:transposase
VGELGWRHSRSPRTSGRVVLRHAGELDRLGAELADVDKSLAQNALEEPRVKRLMTITGVNASVVMSVWRPLATSIGSRHRKNS